MRSVLAFVCVVIAACSDSAAPKSSSRPGSHPTTTPAVDTIRYAALEGSCALSQDSTAYCWNFNACCNLGGIPVRVPGNLKFTSITGDAAYAMCGLTANGDAYCFGNNQWGGLGTGDTVSRSTPTAVVGGLTFAQISTAGDLTCGLTPTGVAYCWGSDMCGGLGNGSGPQSSCFTGAATAVPTPQLVLGGLTFKSIDVGNDICALTPAGALYCWGEAAGPMPYDSVPMPFGNVAFASISPGLGSGCGLTASNAVYCWGFNLGNGDTTFNSPIVPAASGKRFTAISGYQTRCGVDLDGNGWCWGNAHWGHADVGSLGNGQWGSSLVPVEVSGGHHFKTIMPDYTSCGLTTDGDIYCWGLGPEGQLVGGYGYASNVPVLLAQPQS